jgi:hypothetical protein
MKEFVQCPMPTIKCYQTEDFTAVGNQPMAEREVWIRKQEKDLQSAKVTFYPQYLQRGKRMVELH